MPPKTKLTPKETAPALEALAKPLTAADQKGSKSEAVP